ncbi:MULTISPECIES: glycosyltransferase family 2 protein [unclassified Vibrio]|uniref:glycosyltransferase n=1 Tax=unclassified Vibrio TaxID=2614977 RepID=UPI000C83D72F|nr:MULTISPECIES: glycosyltransferase family 2 protein [unclassified Vibrio]PMK79773.1 glycosyl transferase [Vibrio sp. 10N.261.52.E5]TKF85244.1 glycosyltransferase family 2 protein [Vibrio sp. F13]
MSSLPRITVIIKTLNEQGGIAATIKSVQSQLKNYQYDVIVADSLSDDDTQKIALENGAKVVTLINANDRCCGVGHQLGYLYSTGDYLLLLDGDMRLQDGFIDAAIAFLEKEPAYAAVAGAVEMDEANSYEFKSRQQRHHKIYPTGDCSHLAGGGLYRASAINDIGYLTHRTLHAYEEAELGMRLEHAGYKLHRLDTPFFHHTSYDMPTLTLLRYRWNRGYLFASGELLKSAFGKAYFRKAVSVVRNELIFACYLAWLILALLVGNVSLLTISLLPLMLFFAAKAFKNRSIKDGAQSIINLTVFSAGLVNGLLLPIKDPNQPPSHKVLERDVS